MNVMDVFTQAKSLNLQERTELVKLLVDTLSMPQPTPEIKSVEHWGQNLVRLLNEQGPIDLIYPEIEDQLLGSNKFVLTS